MARPVKGFIDPRTANAYRLAKARDVVQAAKTVVVQMRHMQMKGHYFIPPAAILRLCAAIDDVPADLMAKGGE